MDSQLFWHNIRSAFFNAVIVISLLIAVSLAFSALGISFFDAPPVNVKSLLPSFLGTFCPGDDIWVKNQVEIEEPVIALYYIGTLTPDSLTNIPGTQVIYSGFQHPISGVFTHTLPYQAYDLPPGEYTLAFAARGTNTEEETVFITSTFTIGDFCHEEPSANYRSSENRRSTSDYLVHTNGVLADDE